MKLTNKKLIGAAIGAALTIWIFLPTACSAESIPLGWEVVNTNGIGLDVGGNTRTAVLTIPVTQNIILTGVQYNFSMAPTPGWPDPEGFAEALIAASVPVSIASPTGTATIQNANPWFVILGVNPGDPGEIFSAIVKTTYPQNAVLPSSYLPLNIPVRAGQSITLILSYYSATVASDCELQGTIQYKLQ